MTIIKSRWILVAAVALSTLLLSGCVQSKEGYQNQMTKIIKEAGSKLADLTKKPQSNDKVSDEQLKILKETKTKVESVTPPDDFFLGHADMIQFLDFSIKGLELEKKSGTKKPPETDQKSQLVPEQTESLKMRAAANRALGRSIRELPFLEFDLLENFGQLAGGGGIGSPVPVPSQPRRITPQQPQQ